MSLVERVIAREGECFYVGNVRVCIAWARGGKVIIGTPLQDDCGPLTDDDGLRIWAALLRDTIASMQRQDGAS